MKSYKCLCDLHANTSRIQRFQLFNIKQTSNFKHYKKFKKEYEIMWTIRWIPSSRGIFHKKLEWISKYYKMYNFQNHQANGKVLWASSYTN